DEGLDAALEAHLLALLDGVPLVGEHDQHTRVEEGKLAQAMLQRREVELGHGEGPRTRQEGDLRAPLVAGGAKDRERRQRLSVAELDEMLLAVAPDGQLEPGRERIHD